MGQRHQIYIFHHMAKEDKPTCTAFHNQWCYGSLPLRHVQRLARYQKAADKYSRLSSDSYESQADKLQAILSCDPRDGFFQNHMDITSEVKLDNGSIDPDMGDNNDGITIIYIPKNSKRIKYCFMNINCGDSTISKAPVKVPLNANAYAHLYYEETEPKWKSVGMGKLIPWINKNCDLLSLEECHQLLEEWYAPDIEREKILSASPEELPLLVNCYEVNKPILEKMLKGVPV